LPSMPAIYFKILEALQKPDCPIQQIGEIVAQDPALTAKILHLANSSFYGFAREVSNASEAVLLLGVGTLRSLALTLHLFSAFDAVQYEHCSVSQVWDHSLLVGQWAQKIVKMEGGDERLMEETFTAGLLHDIGKLVLADNLAAPYVKLIELAHQQQCPLIEKERETYQATHAEVGAYLLDLWGLPMPLVEAIELHHQPGRTDHLVFGPLAAIHVANLLEQERNAADKESVLRQLDMNYLGQLGVVDRIDAWRETLAASS
jgi:putative nucleotidyltransferase with HDIG domain